MREILVFGDKTFKIRVPDEAKLTFGPFSPPRGRTAGNMQWGEGSTQSQGTLRIYGRTKDDILACFAGVRGFRDLSMGYAEEIAREEGSTIWKDDEKGYVRENKAVRTKEWVEDPARLITGTVVKKRK